MTLIVSAYWWDPATGEPKFFIDWEDGHSMAGVEVARVELWGSESVRRRGATFLPQLADSDLWVQPEDLDRFVAEVRMLLADVDALRMELGYALLPHYLNNFLRAAEYARSHDGGVWIS
jgi:hypothetical protein